MVVLAGIGHLVYGSGIPNRVQRRVGISSAIILNVTSGTEIDPEMADYLLITEQQTLPPSGKLGVFLETDTSPPVISGFSKESQASEAGLEKGDAIVKLDGITISSYTDLRIALMNKVQGETVKVEIERERLILGNMSHICDVELR
jgi:S1-C subfamily serine protease